MFLQHSATLLAVGFMVYDIKKNSISLYAFTMLAFFILFHAIGARWIYSFVPYDQWFATVTGLSLNDLFGWDRNHYDRFVHFAYGILFFPVFYELSKSQLKISPKKAVLFAFLFIQTFSMVYELFEWGLTFMLSPEGVENYNGQQGDVWDAQKDMALALVGSLIYASGILLVLGIRKKRRKPNL